MSKCSLTGILIYHCSFTQNTNFAPQYSNCYWLFWVIQSLIAQNGLTIVRGCLSPSKWHFCSPVNGQLNGFMLCRMHHASFCFACHVMCRYKSSFIWEYQNFIGKILTKDNPKTHTETNFSLSESALGLSPLTELHHTAWGAASQDDMKTKAQKCIQYELCAWKTSVCLESHCPPCELDSNRQQSNSYRYIKADNNRIFGKLFVSFPACFESGSAHTVCWVWSAQCLLRYGQMCISHSGLLSIISFHFWQMQDFFSHHYEILPTKRQFPWWQSIRASANQRSAAQIQSGSHTGFTFVWQCFFSVFRWSLLIVEKVLHVIKMQKFGWMKEKSCLEVGVRKCWLFCRLFFQWILVDCMCAKEMK